MACRTSNFWPASSPTAMRRHSQPWCARHGPMVLSVCRRIMRDFHDAEDSFQATFLVLARKAASLVVLESLGCWLYGVAYRAALETREFNSRRRTREGPMNDVSDPQVMPAEGQDWRPLLDRELNRLPEKYRAAIVLCDLEGRTRKESARLLKVPEGTLSSRLATGRQMLAEPIDSVRGGTLGRSASSGDCTRNGVGTGIGELGESHGEGCGVGRGRSNDGGLHDCCPAHERSDEIHVDEEIAVGSRRGAGFGGHRRGRIRIPSGWWLRRVQGHMPVKPLNELDALRKENELLKLNLQVVLEKVRAQETELHAVRKDLAASEAVRKTFPYPLVQVTGDVKNGGHWQRRAG